MKKLISLVFVVLISFIAFPAQAQYAYPNNYYAYNTNVGKGGGFLNLLKGIFLPYATYSYYGTQYYSPQAYGYPNFYCANPYAFNQQAYISGFSPPPYQGNVPNIAPNAGTGFDSSPYQNLSESNAENGNY